MTKSVVIIGAGPAGLVAAKTLLRHQNGEAFHVTVYEQSHRIGGIWALDEDSTNEGYLSAHTPTNLSRYTVCFSDLSWVSVDLATKSVVDDFHDGRSKVPMFPKAWQAGRYLEAYQSKYLSQCLSKGPRIIKLGRKVVATERLHSHIGPDVWRVTTQDDGGISRVQRFDHMIVASGFFSRPRELSTDLDPLQGSREAPVKIIHSSKYRGLSDLFSNELEYKDKKILIVGGGNSAGEVAGTIAFHLSSAIHASSKGGERYRGCKVYHITPRPLYGIPPFVPCGNGKGGFVPIDVKLYDLASRPAGEILSKSGRLPDDFIPVIHGAIQSMVGGNQSDLDAESVTVGADDQKNAPYVALSESYPEYVRSGDICPVAGRLLRLGTGNDNDASPPTLRAVIENQGQTFEIDDVAAVVHATGYTPSTALEYLPEKVKQKLEYDRGAHRLPLLLDQQQTMSNAIPNLAFIGLYEGPYWGIMEMQARLVAQIWSGALTGVDRPSEELYKMRDLRKAMESKERDVPQYWLGDYLGYMEELSRDLRLKRNDHPFKPREGIVTPARYLTNESSESEAEETMTDLHRTLAALLRGAFTARAAFRAMQGRWTIHRRLESAVASFSSGVFEGIAHFHPRLPSTGVNDDQYDFEYLYTENGTLTTSSGASIPANRRYVYRYREVDDQITVWFVKPDGLTVDYLFHGLEFSFMNSAKSNEHCVAKADHLCINDMYKTQYEFGFRGISLSKFKMIHNVKGPQKDYTSDTSYDR